MKLRTMILAVTLALVSSAVFASSCPKHVKAIDKHLSMAKLSPAKMKEVKKLRDEGEALHKAKKHADSMKTLAKAEKILGI